MINAFVIVLARAVAFLLPRGSGEDQRQAPLNTLKIAAPRGWIALFASHPPLEDRIEALQTVQLTTAGGSAWLAGR